MTLLDSALAGTSWAGVALVQVTLVALLGLLGWLAARRSRPALRAAVLLATLVGLVVVPALAAVAPTWLPLPEWVCPPRAGLTSPRPAPVGPPPPPPLPDRPALVAVRVQRLPAPASANLEGTPQAAGQDMKQPAKAEAFLDLAVPQEEVAPPRPPSEPSRSSWSLAGALAGLWLLGALACLARALGRLALLYRCARRARPVSEQEWLDCLASLAQRHGLSGVALRESPTVDSPLTVGLLRPVILLPANRHDWSDEERALILSHEMAHVARRDFRAGLVAELMACLCWLHPLVRWLAARLRLEQEYAADAWVASTANDSRDYVRCLARLALRQRQGRSSLAPALWRRRPEILRRIDMLQRNPRGLPARLSKRAGWAVAMLAAVICLVVAGVGPLRSAAEDKKPAQNPDARATADAHGDPLPAGAQARLGTTRLRHAANVTFVSILPGGKKVITGSQDGTIRLWDLDKGKEIRRFPRPTPIAAKQPRGKEAVRRATVMQVLGGARSRGRFPIAVTADGKTLAAAGGNVIQLWEIESGKERRKILGPASGVAGLLFSPDGQTLAGRASDRDLFLWSARTGKQMHHFKAARRRQQGGFVLAFGGSAPPAPGMAFTPDSKSLVAAARDFVKNAPTPSIKFWDVNSGKETRKIATPGGVSAVAVARGGKLLAYGTGNIVRLCAADTGKEIHQLTAPDGAVLSAVFSPDGKTLAVRGRNQRVRLWNTATGKELRQLNDAEPPRGGGGLVLVGGNFFAPESRALSISPDGKRVAAAAGSTVRLWELNTGKEVALLGGHWQAPSAIVLSPDGKTVVSWGFDRVVRRWEAASGKALGAFAAPARTRLAAIRADGRIIALANADNTIRLHDTTTGKESRRIEGPRGGIAALTFAPGGKVLALRGNDNVIRLHDVARGTLERQITIQPANRRPQGQFVLVFGGGRPSRGTGPGVAFSPDGRLVAAPVAGGGERSRIIALIDAATGKQLRKIESGQPIASFAFSPDGRSLAAENVDRTVTLWEVATCKPRAQFGKMAPGRPRQGGGGLVVTLDGFAGDLGGAGGPSGPVGLTFSPDGRALAVRGPDLAIHLWDVTAGKEIGQLKGHAGSIATVAFAPNGKALASGATDTTILLWGAAGALKNLSKPKAVVLEDKEVQSLWGDLADKDATRARQSLHKLAAGARQAVPFLGKQLKPAARVDPRKLSGWIEDLESKKLPVRRMAYANLLKVGEQSVPALQKVLASKPPLETRRRAEELVDRLTGGTLTTEQIRFVRAVEALEQMGTPEALRLLRTLAGGAPGTLPTREAQAALDRLTKR
jgi:WD40 repeat protein/beta-lactamase regulating signal transducer with metallopeptidase domain